MGDTGVTDAAPSSFTGEERPRGLVAGVALGVGLIGTALWIGMLAGPWNLSRGLLEAQDHLERASRRLSAGATRAARYRSIAGAEAADRARRGLDSGGPLFDIARGLPKISGVLREADHLVAATEHSSAAALRILSVAEGALDGPGAIIQKDPDDPSGGSEVRLDRLEAVGDTITAARNDVRLLTKELRSIRLKNLPKRSRPSITEAVSKATETDELLADAERGFELLPGILGGDGPRTYLVGMQNSAEQRGTGGAILQFAVLRFEDGKAELQKEARSVYDVDKNRKLRDIPLPKDAWMVKGIEDAHRFGNANWSPDWKLSSVLTVRYGKASDPRFPEVDGMIGVDPVVLRDLMPGVGAFKTERSHTRLTTRRVVPLLLYRTYASQPRSSRRRAVLRDIVDSFFNRVFRPAHPKLLIQGMGTSLANKHLQIYLTRPDEQTFIERMKWDGRIREAKGSDYSSWVEENVGGNKFDFFSDHDIASSIKIDGADAQVSSRIGIHNRVILPLPRHMMGDAKQALHLPMMNLYAPGGALLRGWKVTGKRVDTPGPAVWADGRPAVHTERGKRVFTGTLEIPSGKKGAITFKYLSKNVVRTVAGRKVYRLVIQHQPKARPEHALYKLALPAGASKVKTEGWRRDGQLLVWEGDLLKDMVLEASWKEE